MAMGFADRERLFLALGGFGFFGGQGSAGTPVLRCDLQSVEEGAGALGVDGVGSEGKDPLQRWRAGQRRRLRAG
ncbi:hypothetical protein [Alloacidobacterium sp.]|uniref:hypothetical protein n=1 Tax=Alloacidobacterium sp. TaxID=2951999 RepID=UPI002D607F89|nr:hypothetical protein [Alloacidobacterium sp.]HYK37477.1 hypothetical protein [Alloacidobacterium sp.]